MKSGRALKRIGWMISRVSLFLFVVLMATSLALGAAKDFDIQGRILISTSPPFRITLPSDLQQVHFTTVEHPAENSLTRTYFLVKEKKKQVEEMLIVQFADKTNPQAGPMVVPPLKPFSEKRMYLNGKVKKGEVEVEYLIQLMAWNPGASSVQPIIQKGMSIPSHWALQTQVLFQPRLEQAVFLRYSRDIQSFGLKVSDEGKAWDKESATGNEKKVVESFQRPVLEMVNSLRFQKP